MTVSAGAQSGAAWPHFMQQQSELRWVADAPPHGGAFSPFDPAYPLRFWREFASTAAGREKVLAFDAQPSFGMAMDHLRWDDALRWTRGHLRYVDDKAEVTEAYPFNPNGSPLGIAALCSEESSRGSGVPLPGARVSRKAASDSFRMSQPIWHAQLARRR